MATFPHFYTNGTREEEHQHRNEENRNGINVALFQSVVIEGHSGVLSKVGV